MHPEALDRFIRGAVPPRPEPVYGRCCSLKASEKPKTTLSPQEEQQLRKAQAILQRHATTDISKVLRQYAR